MRAIHLSGTIFLNMLWQADSAHLFFRSHFFFDARITGYSPLDFSIADPHWGIINEWVQFIDALHARGMYIILDFTVGTMSDLIGF